MGVQKKKRIGSELAPLINLCMEEREHKPRRKKYAISNRTKHCFWCGHDALSAGTTEDMKTVPSQIGLTIMSQSKSMINRKKTGN